MPNTWILVTDAAGARVYESRGAGHEMRLVRHLPPRDPRAVVIELATERREPEVEPESGRFARELAWLLGRARAERFFQRLVLVGPTEMLGSLRRELDPPTRALVSHAVMRDAGDTDDLADVVGL